MFWLLSFAALVIFLYFLRRRAPLQTVSALFLWRASTERPRSALSLLWAKIGLLLIQLLVLALIVTGLANPALTSVAFGGGVIAVIIDGSASMQTRYDHHTRYSEALAQAEDYLRRTRPAQLTIIQAQAHNRLLVPMTSDITLALQRLRESRPTLQGDASARDLIEILRHQSGPQPDLREYREIAFFTDQMPSDAVWGNLPVRVIALGKPVQNVAVRGFALRRQPNRDLGYSVWTEIVNYSEADAPIQLEIRGDDEPLHTVTLALKSKEARVYAFDLESTERTRFVAKATLLNGSDAFPYDNERYFALGPRTVLHVLWIGDENTFLERALLANARVRIAYKKSSQGLTPDDLSAVDLVVANNTNMPLVSSAQILMFNSSISGLFEIHGREPAQALRVLQSDHALLRLIETSHIRLTHVRQATVAKPGAILWASGAQPALYALETPEIKLIAFAFSLQESNLVLTVDFPILIRNSLTWLLPHLEPPTPKEVGQALPLAGLGERFEVRDPKGQPIAMARAPGREGLLQTEEPGFYRVRVGESARDWAVNLAPGESEPGTQALREPAVGSSAPARAPAQLPFPLWRFLLLAALLGLIWELFVYDRSLFQPIGGKPV
jgi:hypothetical protein